MIDYKLYNILTQLFNENIIYQYPKKLKIRILIQKICYLITHGYNRFLFPYKWVYYLKGVYSSDLSHMISYMSEFDINIYLMYKNNYTLNIIENQKLYYFKNIIKVLNNKLKYFNMISKEEYYEIITDIIYFNIIFPNDLFKIESKFKILKNKLFNKIGSINFIKIYNYINNIDYF